MPTADSLAAMLKAKSTLIKPITPVIPKAIAKPVVDPSAARYAALEAAAKTPTTSPVSSFNKIVNAQNSQAALVAKTPVVSGSFMNTPGYNAGHAPTVMTPGSFMNTPGYNAGHGSMLPIDDQIGRRNALGEPITTSTAVDKYGVKALPGDQIDRRIALGEPITTDTATDKYGTVTKPVTTTTTTETKDDGVKVPVTPVTPPPPASTWIPNDEYMSYPWKPPAQQEGGGGTGGSDGNGSSGSTTTPEIKTATPDIITIDQETLPAELMTALIFESIGGQELLSLSRHDLITGGNLEYQPIRNMAIINAEYNSGNIIFMPDSASAYLRNFPINWDSHTIESFSDLDSSHIGIESTKNELFLIVTDMKPGEQIEVETLKSVTSYDYTKF